MVGCARCAAVRHTDCRQRGRRGHEAASTKSYNSTTTCKRSRVDVITGCLEGACRSNNARKMENPVTSTETPDAAILVRIRAKRRSAKCAPLRPVRAPSEVMYATPLQEKRSRPRQSPLPQHGESSLAGDCESSVNGYGQGANQRKSQPAQYQYGESSVNRNVSRPT